MVNHPESGLIGKIVTHEDRRSTTKGCFLHKGSNRFTFTDPLRFKFDNTFTRLERQLRIESHNPLRQRHNALLILRCLAIVQCKRHAFRFKLAAWHHRQCGGQLIVERPHDVRRQFYGMHFVIKITSLGTVHAGKRKMQRTGERIKFGH